MRVKEVAIITFVLFMIEAVLHYNLGAKSENPNHRMALPPNKQLLQLALMVGIFSFINGKIISNYE